MRGCNSIINELKTYMKNWDEKKTDMVASINNCYVPEHNQLSFLNFYLPLTPSC